MTRKKMLHRALVGTALALPLAACGGGGGSQTSTTVTPPTVSQTPQEDKFGTVFGTDFRAAANSEPATVNDSDIVPVDPTQEPINIVG